MRWVLVADCSGTVTGVGAQELALVGLHSVVRAVGLEADHSGTVVGPREQGLALVGLHSGVRAPLASGPMFGLEVGEPAVVGLDWVAGGWDGRRHG